MGAFEHYLAKCEQAIKLGDYDTFEEVIELHLVGRGPTRGPITRLRKLGALCFSVTHDYDAALALYDMAYDADGNVRSVVGRVFESSMYEVAWCEFDVFAWQALPTYLDTTPHRYSTVHRDAINDLMLWVRTAAGEYANADLCDPAPCANCPLRACNLVPALL